MAPLPDRSRLIAPSPAAAGAVRAYIARSTVGAALTRSQRLNCFPTNPACTLTWCLQGRVAWLRIGDGAIRRVGRAPVLFSGPITQPSMSWNPGECRIFMCLLAPDALHTLTGLLAADWTDRMVPLPAALDDEWQRIALQVQHAPSDDDRAALLDAFITQRLEAPRTVSSLPVRRGVDWTKSLATRAAASGMVRGWRQAERRHERWNGLPLHDLQGLARAEKALFETRAGDEGGWLDWRDSAIDASFSDHAHLTRATRRIWGSTPQALRRHIENDEAFWVYRLWT